MAGYWLKLYTEILEDPKYYRLSDKAKLGMIEIMLVAKKVDLNGELPELDDVCFYTRRSKEWWGPVFEELEQIEFVKEDEDGAFIRKFSERQKAVDPAERQRLSRELKHQKEFCHEPVTKVSRIVRENRVREDTETDTEVDKEKDKEFITHFLSTSGYSKFSKPSQLETVLEFRNKYGVDVVLDAAKWAKTTEITPMSKVISSLQTALPGWTIRERRPVETIPRGNSTASIQERNKQVIDEILREEKDNGNT